jgi:hypothetical protein
MGSFVSLLHTAGSRPSLMGSRQGCATVSFYFVLVCAGLAIAVAESGVKGRVSAAVICTAVSPLRDPGGERAVEL